VPAGNCTPHAPRAVEWEKAAPRARERWSIVERRCGWGRGGGLASLRVSLVGVAVELV
jgi:hypothetical protein